MNRARAVALRRQAKPPPDYVIIGGGLFGCGTAWELAKRGASAVVLEGDRIASGASGGPGMRGVRANSRDEAELPLARMAIELWPELDRSLGGRTGYRRTGGLELFESEASRERAERQVALQEGHGVASRLVDKNELREIEPGLSANVLGAVYSPDDGVADHTATTRALAEAARAAGAVVREGTRVERLEGGRTVVLEGNEGIAATRAVVVLANAGAARLLSTIGVDIELPVVFPQVLLTEPINEVTVRHLIGHMERRLALKRLPGGEIMISGGWLGRWSKAAGRAEAVRKDIEGNMVEARAVFPALRDITAREAFADRAESVGPGLLPIIDRAPGLESVFVAAGWTGHGFALAPAVNRLLAEWLLEGRKPKEFEAFGWRS